MYLSAETTPSALNKLARNSALHWFVLSRGESYHRQCFAGVGIDGVIRGSSRNRHSPSTLVRL